MERVNKDVRNDETSPELLQLLPTATTDESKLKPAKNPDSAASVKYEPLSPTPSPPSLSPPATTTYQAPPVTTSAETIIPSNIANTPLRLRPFSENNKRKQCAKKHLGLTEEQIERKRLRNNELERVRQQALQSAFRSLGDALPGDYSVSKHKPASKIFTLENALTYISELAQAIVSHDLSTTGAADPRHLCLANFNLGLSKDGLVGTSSVCRDSEDNDSGYMSSLMDASGAWSPAYSFGRTPTTRQHQPSPMIGPFADVNPPSRHTTLGTERLEQHKPRNFCHAPNMAAMSPVVVASPFYIRSHTAPHENLYQPQYSTPTRGVEYSLDFNMKPTTHSTPVSHTSCDLVNNPRPSPTCQNISCGDVDSSSEVTNDSSCCFLLSHKIRNVDDTSANNINKGYNSIDDAPHVENTTGSKDTKITHEMIDINSDVNSKKNKVTDSNNRGNNPHVVSFPNSEPVSGETSCTTRDNFIQQTCSTTMGSNSRKRHQSVPVDSSFSPERVRLTLGEIIQCTPIQKRRKIDFQDGS